MTKNTKKLLLYLVVNDTDIIYNISPTPDLIRDENQFAILEFDIDTNKRTSIKLDLISKKLDSDYIQINNITLNGIQLTDFDLFSVYQTSSGKIKKTNGWLDEVGSCIINIRSNPISQNILTYLLSTKNGQNI